MLGSQSVIFRKFATELWPLIEVGIQFLFNILRPNRFVETKFFIHIIIYYNYIGIVILIFRKFATELRPLIDIIIQFLFNILRTNGLIETKFCIDLIIDKIYIGNVKDHFFAKLHHSY